MPSLDVAAETPASLPAEFGKYSILGHLATGGMAEVYVARQGGLEGFQKIVVIKRIRPELTTDSSMMNSFLDEARLVATLEHPNIAQVYEIGLVNGSYFFVMEYVHGADLRRLMSRAIRDKKTVSLADAVYIVSHVCAALHYAHEKKSLGGEPLDIIHRDVSPSNVLLSYDGAVKVCDFGIAKTHNQTHETQRGTIKGKYSYMSPEQCKCEPLDRRSDVFALGVILYEATTLTPLFRADNDFELLRMIVDRPVPPPSTRVASYPPDLERIVMKALAKDPDDRYASAQEMQLELEAFAREHKLAMSSISLANLVSSLFEKKAEPWRTAPRPKTDEPVFAAVGTDLEIEVETAQRPSAPEMPVLATGTPLRTPAMPLAPRRPSALWLVGVVLAGLAGGAATLAGRMIQKNDATTAKQALDADVDKIATAIDETVRSARMRADSLAQTPVLRAAIETDSATMKDVAEHEYVLSVAKHETLEFFQVHGGAASSLLRLPATATALVPPKPQETRLQVDGNTLIAVVSAPIAGNHTSVAGTLALAVPVDLALARRTLAEHAVTASLTGAGIALPIVGGTSAGAHVTIPVALSGDIAPPLAIVAAPTTRTLTWVAPVRSGAFGLAGLFLLVYVAGLRRGRS